MPEPIFMKLGMYIMAPELILTEYLINLFSQSACLYIYFFVVAGQRLSENVTAATNTYAEIKEFSDEMFSIRSVSYERKVGD
jgi:hypothetical protein